MIDVALAAFFAGLGVAIGWQIVSPALASLLFCSRCKRLRAQGCAYFLGSDEHWRD